MTQTLRIGFLFIFLSSLTSVNAQLIDFEDQAVSPGNPLFQTDDGEAIEIENLHLENNYNPKWDSWTGFAISADNDNTTPGFLNQYSCISGTGADESAIYAVAYAPETVSLSLHDNPLINFSKISINNSTYAYLSMRDGDNFAKKFGGVTGDDPDFFLLTIHVLDSGSIVDSMEFYLADYRFEDNSQDYILDTWTEVDLTDLVFGDELRFSLSSSDVGTFGMNTPAYFNIDNVVLGLKSSVVEEDLEAEIKIFPNPVADRVTIETDDKIERVELIDNYGRILQHYHDQNTIDISHYQSGFYHLYVNTTSGNRTISFIKE